MTDKLKKKIWISLFTLLVIGGTGTYFGARIYLNRRMEGWKRDGIAASKAGNHKDAIFYLAGYLRRHAADPKDPSYMESLTRYENSCELEESGKHVGEAVAALKLLVGHQPDRIEYRRRLLEIYVKQGRGPEALDTGKAIRNFLQGKKLPDDVRTLELMTDVLMQLRQYSEALKIVQAWVKVAPADLHANMSMVSLMASAGQPADSVFDAADHLRAVVTNDAEFELLQGFAHNLFRNDPSVGQSARQSAAGWLKKSAAHQAVKDDFLQLLVQQFDAAELFDESLALLKESVKKGAGRDIRVLLARRLWELRDWGSLATALSNLDPHDAASSATLIGFKFMALAKTGKAADAAACRSELENRKGNPAARAWVLVLKRETDPSKFIEDKQLRLECREPLPSPVDRAYLQYFLAEAESRLGERDLAIQDFRSAAGHLPTWSLPAVRLVDSLLEKGRVEEAFQFAYYANKQHPTDAGVAIGLARAWSAAIEAGAVGHSDELLAFVDAIQKYLPNEERTELIRLNLLAQKSDKAAATKVARSIIGKIPAPSEQAFLAVASISEKYNLGVEQECYAGTEKANGLSARLAYARAVVRFKKAGTEEGLKLFDGLLAASQRKGDPLWNLTRCQYMDGIHHPKAHEAWVALGEAFPTELQVQHSVLAARAVQTSSDSKFTQATIDRLKILTGDHELTWQLAQARLLIDASDPEKNTAGAKLLIDLITLYPSLPEPRVLLAKELVRTNHIEAAITYLSDAVQLEPTSIPTAMQLAMLLQSHKDFERARQVLDRIMPLLHSTEDRRQVALLLAQQGNLEQSIGLLESSKEDPGADESSKLLLAILYGRRGEFGKAEEIVNKLLQQEPDFSVIQFAASFYASTGRRAQAEKVMLRLDDMKLEPGIRELVWGGYCAENADVAEAIKHYQRVTQQTPANQVAWRTLVTAQMSLVQYDNANATLNEALKAVPNDPPLKSIKEQFGLLRTAASDPELRPVVLSFMRDPATSEISRELLITMTEGFRTNDMQRLAASLQQLSDKYPRSVAIQLQLIRCLGNMRRISEALATADRTMSAFPDDPEPARIATAVCENSQRWTAMLSTAQTWKKRSGFKTMPVDVAMAMAMIKTGSSEAALHLLEPYLSVANADPIRNSDVLVVYSFALADTGHMKEANELLWPLAQKTSEWRFRWIQTCIDFKDTAAGLAWLDQVATVIPADALDERVALAEGYDRMGTRADKPDLTKKSGDIFAQVTALPKVTSIQLLAAGAQAERAKSFDNAEKYYLRAIALDGNLWIAKNNLAMLLVRRGGDLKLAGALATEASKLRPRSVDVRDTVAAVQAKEGNPAEAAKTLRGAVLLDPDNLKWRISLAQYLVDAGDLTTAGKEIALVDAGHFDPNAVLPDLRQQLDSIRTRIKKPR